LLLEHTFLKLEDMCGKKYLAILVFLIGVLLYSICGAYNFDCDQDCETTCNGDFLCLIQCYSCCPVTSVTLEENCSLCGGYWYDNACHLTPQDTTTSTTSILGDVSGNNQLNIIDALLTARCALQLSTCPSSVADVNCDTLVNIVDALLIARKALNLSVVSWCQ